jgi:hypothetical protein
MIAERVVPVSIALASKSEDIYTLLTIEWPFFSPKNKSTCKWFWHVELARADYK